MWLYCKHYSVCTQNDSKLEMGSGCVDPNSKYVKLISSDGRMFIMKREYVLMSGTIKAMLERPRKYTKNNCNKIHFNDIQWVFYSFTNIRRLDYLIVVFHYLAHASCTMSACILSTNIITTTLNNLVLRLIHYRSIYAQIWLCL